MFQQIFEGCLSQTVKGKKKAGDEGWELHLWVRRDPKNVLVLFGSGFRRLPLHRAILPKDGVTGVA